MAEAMGCSPAYYIRTPELIERAANHHLLAQRRPPAAVANIDCPKGIHNHADHTFNSILKLQPWNLLTILTVPRG